MSSSPARPPFSWQPLRLVALRGAIRALWFGAVPVLLALVSYRYLFPRANAGFVGGLAALAELASRFPAPLMVALFLLYAAVIQYWAPRLPGSSSWLRVPAADGRAARRLAIGAGGVALAVAAALLLRAQYQPYRVLSASMLPTLEPGVHVLGSQVAYGASSGDELPQRGEVVVFGGMGENGGPTGELVKRVVGLPGDTIRVEFGHVTINDWQVPSCEAGRYLYASGTALLDAQVWVEFLGRQAYLTAHSKTAPQPATTYLVKAGEVFVLGDNRNNSIDSRSWNAGRGGGLPVEQIRAHAERLLLGVRSGGELDPGLFLAPFGLLPRFEGLDDSALRAGIARCLSERPDLALPPAAPKLSSVAGVEPKGSAL